MSITELARRDVLVAEKNKAITDITIADINIKVLEKTESTKVIARQVLSRDSKTGKPTSFKDILVPEHLQTVREERANMVERLNAIEDLLKQDDKEEN